jgi:hypothetical protein
MTSVAARSTGRTSLTVCLSGIVTQFVGLPMGMRDRLRDLLAPFEADGVLPDSTVSISWRNDPPLWIVKADGASRSGFRAESDLLRYLEWIPVARAAQASAQDVIVHAAAVVKESMTILLAGDSGAGKTTMTIGLTQRGWLPLSDDSAFISRRSFVVAPFPRCFHVDEFTFSTIERPALFEEAGSLEGYLRPLRWADAAARVTCLVRLSRDPAAPSATQSLSQAEGAGVILQAAISAGASRREVACVAVHVAAGASCWQVNNGALADTLDELERLAATGQRV